MLFWTFDWIHQIAIAQLRLQYMCFLVNFVKLLRTLIYRAPPNDFFWIFSLIWLFLRRRELIETRSFSIFGHVLSWLLMSFPKETPTQVFSCEYCEIFKNICESLPLKSEWIKNETWESKCSAKKLSLNIYYQNSQENTCRLATLLKRNLWV